MSILKRKIEKNKGKEELISNKYLLISLLGKNLKLEIKYKNNKIIELDKKDEKIILYLPKKYKTVDKVNIVNMAIEKMYNEIAEIEIENSMEKARIILGFAPEDYIIKRMKNSFCKSEKNKIIIVNPDIVKYNKKIIDVTIIQAFCKIKYSINSKKYAEVLKRGIKEYEEYEFKILKLIDKQKNIKKVS